MNDQKPVVEPVCEENEFTGCQLNPPGKHWIFLEVWPETPKGYGAKMVSADGVTIASRVVVQQLHHFLSGRNTQGIRDVFTAYFDGDGEAVLKQALCLIDDYEHLMPKRTTVDSPVTKPSSSEEDLKPKTVTFLVAEDSVYEAISTDEGPMFLTCDAGRYGTHTSVLVDGQEYLPETHNSPYDPYRIQPIDLQDRPTLDALAARIMQELQRFLDVDPWVCYLLTAAIIQTYRQHHFLSTGYLLLVGEPDSGKSRAMKLLANLAYRPLYGSNFTAPEIFTYLNQHPWGVILEDEFTLDKHETDKLKIYKMGYTPGGKVPRITVLANGDRRTDYFQPYGFKAIAGERDPWDRALQSRCIRISMVNGDPERDEITQADLSRWGQIRTDLLCWRVHEYHTVPVKIETSLKGRSKEIWMPLLRAVHGVTANDVDLYEELLKEASRNVTEKLEERRESLEGKIITVFANLSTTQDGCEYPTETVWSLLTNSIEGQIDERKPHFFHSALYGKITKSSLSRNVKVLGGELKNQRHGPTVQRVYVMPPNILGRNMRKYGIMPDVTLVTLVTDPRGIPHGSQGGSTDQKSGLDAYTTPSRIEHSAREGGYCVQKSVTSVTSVTPEFPSENNPVPDVTLREGDGETGQSEPEHVTVTTSRQPVASLSPAGDGPDRDLSQDALIEGLLKLISLRPVTTAEIAAQYPRIDESRLREARNHLATKGLIYQDPDQQWRRT